jgi:hypothetical protein
LQADVQANVQAAPQSKAPLTAALTWSSRRAANA